MSPMLVRVRHQLQYRWHGRHSETVCPREGCARGRNFTDVSELPSEHGVHRRKTVDRSGVRNSNVVQKVKFLKSPQPQKHTYGMNRLVH